MGMNLNNDVFSTEYVLSKCDTNKDGKTTVTEFLKERNNSIFGYDDLNKKAIALLKGYAGSDGILSTAEYASWLGSSDYDKLLEENKIRSGKDIQEQRNNGTYKSGISKEHLQNLLSDKAYMEETEKILLQRDDKNKDGIVTVEEFTEGLEFLKKYEGDYYQRAVEAAKKYAVDDKIDAKEYITWLNSEDYGTVLDDTRIIDGKELEAEKKKATNTYEVPTSKNLTTFWNIPQFWNFSQFQFPKFNFAQPFQLFFNWSNPLILFHCN